MTELTPPTAANDTRSVQAPPRRRPIKTIVIVGVLVIVGIGVSVAVNDNGSRSRSIDPVGREACIDFLELRSDVEQGRLTNRQTQQGLEEIQRKASGAASVAVARTAAEMIEALESGTDQDVIDAMVAFDRACRPILI